MEKITLENLTQLVTLVATVVCGGIWIVKRIERGQSRLYDKIHKIDKKKVDHKTCKRRRDECPCKTILKGE